MTAAILHPAPNRPGVGAGRARAPFSFSDLIAIIGKTLEMMRHARQTGRVSAAQVADVRAIAATL
jgi:hypothetical protein